MTTTDRPILNRRRAWIATAVAAALALLSGNLPAASRPAERARHAMVAAAEPLAAAEGLRVLREGGNAVDAAVTMACVLAVTYPRAGNIGGGGYMLIRPARGEPIVLDFREVAPAAATRDMFLDAEGEPIAGSSTHTYRAVGVPGTVSGLALALRRGGTVPLARALAPAIRYAREGFIVGRGLEEELAKETARLERYPASRALFFKDGKPLVEGDRLVQEDLARTLEEIARDGPDAFYKGRIAQTLAKDVQDHGGLITKKDLAGYETIAKAPLEGRYRGHRILSAPPSSSGGVALVQILNMLEPFDLRSMGHNSSQYIHCVTEAMKRAFADRAQWLGDPDFVDVPFRALIAPDYARSLMRSFDPRRATPAAVAGPGDPRRREGDSTTHLSVLDASGMAVSCTLTLNDSFGCGAVATGLGFLLNDEMDDFSAKPGAPNAYGLVGGTANAIAPGKRMLSSMSPTIVTAGDGADERPWLVLGSPGGPSIISAIAQTILNVTDFQMDLQGAVDAPRFHHQWSPDRIMVDRGVFPRDVIDALMARGHEVEERDPKGEVQAIQAGSGEGWILGASDARGFGESLGY